MGSVALAWKYLALAFSALLPVINPFGSALMFLGLIGDAPASAYQDLAAKIAVRAALFLLVTELAGSALLRFFGISLPIVEVSGGLVLAVMGWRMLNQQEVPIEPAPAEVSDTRLKVIQQKIFYPLTFPVTVGPGCIVVMLTLSAHASSNGTLQDVMAHVGILVAVVLLSLVVYVCYRYAPGITARISAQTAHGVLRVIAFVLLCIGVQITWNGLESLLAKVLTR